MSTLIDRLTDDVSQWKPRLKQELLFWPDRTHDQVRYRIEIPSRHKFFSVGYEEYVLISLLDGKTTVAQACGRAAQTLGRAALTQRKAESIVHWLLQQQMVLMGDDPVAASEIERAGEPDSKPNGLTRFNPFWIKLPLPHVERGIAVLATLGKWFFSPLGLLAASLLMAFAAISISLQWDRFVASSSAIFSPGTWLATLLTWVVLKFIHELGHAAAAQRYGCETTQVGIVFVLFAPLAYVDVTTSWRLRSRWQRMAIAAAGMHVELTIAAIAAIAWGWVDSPTIAFHLFNVILAASLSTVLFNANPLMRFDGYFILTDLLQLPNLATESALAVRDLASRFFFARSAARERYVGWRRVFVIGYGLAAIGWRILICLSLAMAAAFMFRGGGVLLVAFGLFAWVVRPGIAGLRSLSQRWQRDPAACVRGFLVAGSLAVLITAGVFYLPISTAIVAPAIVDQGQDVAVRTTADGFVVSIGVVDGATVEAGDVLIQLENEDLQLQYSELQTAIAQSEIRQRSATEQQDVSAAQIEQENQQGMEARLQQLATQLDGLTIRAHRSGTIVARGLADQMQQFVREGTELLTIVQPSDRRIVASIAQSDIRQVALHVGEPVAITTAARDKATGHLVHVHPLATVDLRYPALAAVHDGPLAVRSDEQTSDAKAKHRLLSPRFEAIIEFDQAAIQQLPVGQTARVEIGRNSLMLFERLQVGFHNMLQTHRDAAGG